MIIYHGSNNIIEKPEYGLGKKNNDYGFGFYCTQSLDLAKEWACSEEISGYANKYELNTNDLSVLDLSNGQYNILNWLAILLENRQFNVNADVAQRAKEYILETFEVDYKKFDIIKGYRADDSYFSFANAFLQNTISLSQLERALLLGKLGEQIVLKSKKAFDSITFIESYEARKEIFYPKKKARDDSAREEFRKEKNRINIENEFYVLDIIRGRWKNDDTRIQRILLK